MFYQFQNIDWHVILMADHLSNSHSNIPIILSHEVSDDSWFQEFLNCSESEGCEWLFLELMPDQIFKPVQSP